MKIKDIINMHKKTYDLLAIEYNNRMNLYTEHQKKVLEPFIEILNENFLNDISILDVGCGVGLDLKIMNDQGFNTYGMDISLKMIEYAKKYNPTSIIVIDDFASYKFDLKFHGVLMDAFIHLFPKKEIEKIFQKLDSILLPNGFGFISTTKHNNPREGLRRKKDYTSKIERYRAFWSTDELEMSIKKFGFTIEKRYEDYESNFSKNWMNFIIQKTNN